MSEVGGDDKPLRLNQDVREALLDANEGFTDSTYYSAKNFSEQRNYEISDGKLKVHSRSKTSWADSRRESDFVADDAATHRFLRERLHLLNSEGVREAAAVIKAERKATATAERRVLSRQGAPTCDSDGTDDPTPEANVNDTDTDNSVERAGVSPPAVIAGLAALGAAVWLAPRAKTAWQTKGKPRLDAWRARRAAAKESPVERAQDAGGAGQTPEVLN